MTALLDHLWQSTLFALLPGALALLLRRREAGARFWLWFAASVKFLIPFSALAALGTALALPALPVLPDAPTLVVLQQAAAPFAAAAPSSAAPAGGPDWVMLLLAVWAAGVALMLLVWGRRWLTLQALVKAARTLPLRAPLPVLESSSPIEPGLVGIWRPVLMLPGGIAARLSSQEMDAILAHELCHFRRRDNLTAAIHMLVESLFWFHPLVWWLGRRMMQERERACDEAVLAAGNDPRVFAEGILNVCRFYVPAPAAGAALLTGADLRSRIEAILANRTVRRLRRVEKLGLAAVAVASLSAPLLAGGAEAMRDLPDAARVARAYDDQTRPRHAVPYNPADFDEFGGVYQGDTTITLTRAGAHFYARRDLGVASTHMMPRIEILPESAGSFFASDRPAQFSFTRDALGRVNGLVFHQSGLERWFKRIDADAAANIAAAIAVRAGAGKASPGTAAALVRYIQALRRNTDTADASAGIKARAQLGFHGAARYLKNFGTFKSLRFQGVAPDGMDLYDVDFAGGHIQWWIAPLASDGRILWAGFANPARKG